MEKIIDQITEKLKAAFASCGYEEKYGMASVSNRPDLCQYQCNGAMAAAKQYKKAPIIIANEVAALCEKEPMFEKLEAVMPGFINITLSNDSLLKYMEKMSNDERLGCSLKEPKTVIVDYGGANVAKPLHVGHLRSAIIGESVKRIKRFAGDSVIGDVHLGDWGMPMGLIIEELRDRKPELPYYQEDFTGEYPKEAPFTIGELEEIYPAASARSKEDENFKERAHLAVVKLQNGDAAFTALWNHIMAVSLEDLKKNYDRLNVRFDLWKGESNAQPYIPEMLEDLRKRGVAYESAGALVIDVAKESDTKEMPPCIVRKSDGGSIYATSDLGTILEREKLHQPDQYIYLADKRQELYFTQVFRAARKAGYVKPETKLDYIGFGTMNGRDGKPFKTRAGGVMRLEYLIREIEDAVYARIMENRETESISEEEARNNARIIGLAALKYGDLSNQASKDYIFDIERFTSFEGNTGPYILYTMVRIKSILSKNANYSALDSKNMEEKTEGYSNITEEYSNSAEKGEPEICSNAAKETEKYSTETEESAAEYSKSETDMMLAAVRFPDTMERAVEELAPHRICQYIFELANGFNSFYHEHRILAEQNKKTQARWLALITLVLRILETSIDLLGFEAPDKM